MKTKAIKTERYEFKIEVNEKLIGHFIRDVDSYL